MHFITSSDTTTVPGTTLHIGLGTGVGVDAAGGEPSGDTSIADAGKELLAGLTEEQQNTPIADLDDGEGDEIDAGLTPTPAEAATDVGELLTRETDGAEWNEDAERWTLNGKFVDGGAPDGWKKPAPPAKAAGAPDPAAAADKADKGDAKPVKVTLPGIGDRGEEDIEVEVDPELATRIQRLKNDGMRAREYATRRADLDAREAALEAYSNELELDPIGYHINKMPADARVDVLRALLVDHLDEVIPDIERLQDPTKRMVAMRETQGKVKESGDRMALQQRVATSVKQIMAAVETVIPDGTDETTAREFMADARRELAAVADRGDRVTPENVKQLLARRVKLYGFDTPRPVPKPAAVPTARPVSDRARDIAAARRPDTADPAAVQSRIRRTQLARTAATRIAPASAGAAPTQTPALPPEAEADIASVGRYLRKQGLPDSWRPASE